MFKALIDWNINSQFFIYGLFLFLILLVLIVEIVRAKRDIEQRQFNFVPNLPVLLYFIGKYLSKVILTFNYPYLLFLLGNITLLIIEVPTWLFPSKEIFKKRTGIIVMACGLSLGLAAVIWSWTSFIMVVAKK